MPVGALLAPAIASGLGAIGVSSGIASIAAPILGGAAGGALLSGVTGGSPLTGALGGAAGGALGDIFGGIGSAFGGSGGGGLFSGLGSLFGGSTDTTASGMSLGGSGGFGFGGSSIGTPVAAATQGAGAVPSLGNNLVGSVTQGGGDGGVTGGSGSLSAASLTGDVGGGGSSAGGNVSPLDVTSAPAGGTTSPTLGTGQYATGLMVPGTDTPLAGGSTTPSFTNLGTGGNQNFLGNLLKQTPASLISGMLGNNNQAPNNAQINAPIISAMTGAQGMQTALTAPTFNGVLPPGQQQALENERRKRYASIEGQAAKSGMSGSTMERDAKEQADMDISQEQVGIEQQMLSQAYQYAGLANTDANNLANMEMKEQQNYQTNLNSLTAALQKAGTSGGTGYNPPGTGQTVTGGGGGGGGTQGSAGTTSSDIGSTADASAYSGSGDYGGGGDYSTGYG